MFWGRGTIITAPEAFFEFYGGSDEFDNPQMPSAFGAADKLDLTNWKDPRVTETLLKKAVPDAPPKGVPSNTNGTDEDPEETDEIEAGGKADAPIVKRRGRPPGLKKMK